MRSASPLPVALRLSVFYFAYFAHLGAFVAYFSLWLQARGYSPAEIAAVLAVPAVLRIFAPALWGWLADGITARLRGGQPAFVALLAALAAASFAMLTQAGDLRAVFAWIALTALFTSGILPLVDAMALAALSGRPGRYGPVRLWGSIGFIASVMAAGAWLDRAPVTVLLPLVAALMFCAALSALGLPRARSVPPHADPRGALQVLREPRVAMFFAACFCMTVAHGALYAFYSIHLVEHGYSTTTVGALWTLGVVAEIVVFVALPVLFRRFSLSAILIASFAAATARFVTIGWGIDSIALLACAQLLHGLTFGAYHAAAIASVQRMFGSALAVRGQALYASLSYGAGGVAGTLLSGWTWGAFGPEITFAISSAFGLAGGLLVAWQKKGPAR
ncbi:MAG TPA: MFS transporter [Burkholderiales bacterium]|nr:MFS transporter [Burkholderiales bacterium]